MKMKFSFKVLIVSVLQLTAIVSAFGTDAAKTFNEKYYAKHIESLPYLAEKNPKIIILFSATPGMGKTWLSMQLEEHFRGVRISSDEVRALLRKETKDEKIIDDYILWAMKKVSNTTPNHMIILDRTIDRGEDRYKVYETFAKNFGYEIFLVRLVADKEKVEKRIRSRGTNSESFIKRMDYRWSEYENSAKRYPADYTFDNREDSDKYVSELFQAIQKKIDSISLLSKIQPGTKEYRAIREEIINGSDSFPAMQEILPSLYLGSEAAINNLDASFSHILCFRSGQRNYPSHLACKRIAIPDRSDSYLIPIFEETYDYIDNAKGNILVTCKLGNSRSAAIVIAYIMKKFNVSFEKAYHYVKQKRSVISPHPSFLEELKVYEKILKWEQAK